jgi:tellurite resistance protein
MSDIATGLGRSDPPVAEGRAAAAGPQPAGGPAPVSETLALVAPGRPMLDYLPVGLFGSVMGVTGLSVAWRLAHARYGAPEGVSLAIAAVAVTAFVLMVIGYTTKLLTAFGAVRQEFHHPIAGNLFGTVLISLLQLPIVLAPVARLVAQGMWVLGAAGMLIFAWLIVSRWMTDRQQVAHATPAWIIPVVGLLNVPLALPALGFPPLHGLMVATLAIGLFFAVPLFTLIFSRLLFEPPLPAALRPSLLILVAPFAVGYSAYTVTAGQTDLFAEALYALTLFVLAVLLGQLRDLPLSCPFRVSWWAVSFPLAASSVAALRFATARPGLVPDTIALALLALATVVIAGLLIGTLVDISRGGLRNLST